MKLRHYLKAHHQLPDFPRADDIHFEITQHPKYLKGEPFSFAKMKEILTFKIDKKTWEAKMEELERAELVERIDKSNFKIKEED